jgi:hypothetical protein
METFKEHIDRYFKAIYGKAYGFRAPETFPNALERWMLAIANDNTEMANEELSKIEAWAEANIWAHSDDTH